MRRTMPTAAMPACMLQATRLAMPSSAVYGGPTMLNAFNFSSGQVAKKETLRERELRRAELSRMMESWKCTVGFEFHVQMNSKHKMFSSKYLSNFYDTKLINVLFFLAASLNTANADPNTHANFVDLALPGMLPVLNEECLDLGIKSSLALGGRILPQIKFDRKHFTYSDLP